MAVRLHGYEATWQWGYMVVYEGAFSVTFKPVSHTQIFESLIIKLDQPHSIMRIWLII